MRIARTAFDRIAPGDVRSSARRDARISKAIRRERQAGSLN